VHDLARVFRPPGSFNAKGDDPRLVELLEHHDAHYRIEEICSRVEPPRREQPRREAPRARRSTEHLPEAHPRLLQLARRDGRAPGDGSASAWDMTLGCESRRCASTSREEVAELIRHARGLHDEAKGQRDDYVEKTVKAVFKAEPEGDDLPEDEPDLDAADALDLGKFISDEWNLPYERRIVAGQAIGSGDAAIVWLTLANGERLRFRRLGEFFDLAAHVKNVSIIARCECPSLKKDKVILIAQKIIRLCELSVDPDEDLAELQGWLNEFVRGVKWIDGELRAPGKTRWDAFVSIDDAAKVGKVVGITDGERVVWLPADPLMRHVRYVERAKIDWAGLISRMEELGWEHHRLGARQPGVEREQAKRIRRSFFAGTGPEVDDDE
jgi:hypothetical protein